jgi:hypothetical protein
MIKSIRKECQGSKATALTGQITIGEGKNPTKRGMIPRKHLLLCVEKQAESNFIRSLVSSFIPRKVSGYMDGINSQVNGDWCLVISPDVWMYKKGTRVPNEDYTKTAYSIKLI